MKYSVILADCPWPYNSRAPHQKTRFGGGATAKYPVMKLADIQALPVADLAAKDAMLFFWTTGPYLEKAFDVIKAWGFKFISIGFTWMKQNRSGNGLFFGTGYFAKHNAEFCLLAKRGKPIKPATNRVSSAVLAPVQAHSKKPEEVIRRIDELYPDANKLELFARQTRVGWTSVGNEITGRDIREDIELLKEGSWQLAS